MSLIESQFVRKGEAVETLFLKWTPENRIIKLPLCEALGCVTHKDIYSKTTLPVYRSSLCDGIAVRAADFENGSPNTREWVRGRDYVQADTGDDFSDDFDAVIAIEDVSFEHGYVELSPEVNVSLGMNIKKKGETVWEGDLLVKNHTVLQPSHLSILATGGYEKIEVIDKPKVAFIPTGNELVPMGTMPTRGQNIESDGVMVQGTVEQLGGEVITYPIIKDDVDALRAALMRAVSEADIVLIVAGSSKGEEDFNAKLLEEEASWIQHGVYCIPGRVAALSMIDNKPVINLPGPPVGCFCALDWAVAPIVRRFLGLPAPIRPKVKAVLQDEITKPESHDFYVRLELKKKKRSYIAHTLTWNRNLPDLLSRCNALFIAPIGRNKWCTGEEIMVELLCSEELIPSE